MNTRRGFLQASSLAIAGRLSEASLPGQETPKGGQPTHGVAMARDYWNDFPNYLMSAIKAARSRRKSSLSRVRTTKEATERASFVSKKVWELIGGQLEKTPLNATTTGEICATIAPRPIWMLNPVDANGDGLALSQLAGRYAKTTQAYAALQQPSHFSLHVESGPNHPAFGEWVRTSLS